MATEQVEPAHSRRVRETVVPRLSRSAYGRFLALTARTKLIWKVSNGSIPADRSLSGRTSIVPGIGAALCGEQVGNVGVNPMRFHAPPVTPSTIGTGPRLTGWRRDLDFAILGASPICRCPGAVPPCDFGRARQLALLQPEQRPR